MFSGGSTRIWHSSIYKNIVFGISSQETTPMFVVIKEHVTQCNTVYYLTGWIMFRDASFFLSQLVLVV